MNFFLSKEICRTVLIRRERGEIFWLHLSYIMLFADILVHFAEITLYFKKNVPFYVFNNFVKHEPILIRFVGKQHHEETCSNFCLPHLKL